MRHHAPPLGDATLTLRPIERRDADAWFAYLSMPDVVEHTSWDVRDVDPLRRIIDECDADRVDSPVRFAVVDRNDALVGTIGFPLVSATHRTAEVAYDFHPAVSGRGVATRCCRVVTAWALDELGFVRVQATTLDTNVASRRVVEKCGYAYEGTLRKLKMVRGEPRDFHLFATTS